MTIPYQANWLVIPKGFRPDQPSILKMTVVVRMPSDTQPTVDHNWSQYIHDHLSELWFWTSDLNSVTHVDPTGNAPSILSPSKIVHLSDSQRTYIEPQLWSTFFRDIDPLANPAKKRAGNIRFLRRTSHFISTACLQMLAGLVFLHRFKHGRGAGFGRLQALKAQELFYSTGALGGASLAAQAISDALLEVSRIFSPVRPSAEERFAVLDASQAHAHVIGGPLDPFLIQLADAYTPVDKRASGSSQDSKLPAGLRYGEPQGLGLTALSPWALSLAGDIASELAPGTPQPNVGPWAEQLVRHVVTSFPVQRLPVDSFAEGKTATNLLAMLMRESGLLAKMGFQFDLECEFPNISSLTAPYCVRVAPSWDGVAPLNTDQSPWSVLNAQGLPSIRAGVTSSPYFDERGLFELGLLDVNGEPRFLISDLNVATAALKMRSAVQHMRNLLAEFSPAVDPVSGGVVMHPEFESHAPSLLWNGRLETVSDISAPRPDTFRYLQDMLVGIRPDVGVRRPEGGDWTWYRFFAESVEYHSGPQGQRTSLDLDRDESYFPLRSDEIKSAEVNVVDDLLLTWRGFPDPGRQAPVGRFGKRVSPEPEQVAARRFGFSYALGGRLVLIDGSSLISANDAHSLYATGPLVADKGPLPGMPFTHQRWERLCAPVVLAEDVATPSGWWSLDSETRVSLSTRTDTGFVEKGTVRRYIVPGCLKDGMTVSVHGMFDHEVMPSATALKDFERTVKYGAFPISSRNGLRVLRHQGGWGGKSGIPPYHPDPLVDQVVIWLGRRFGDKLENWAPIRNPDGSLAKAEIALNKDRAWPDLHHVELLIAPVPRTSSKPIFEPQDDGLRMMLCIPEGEVFQLRIAPGSQNQSRLLQEHRLSGTSQEAMIRSSVARVAGTAAVGEINTLQAEPSVSESPWASNVTDLDVEHLVQKPITYGQVSLSPDIDASGNPDPRGDGSIHQMYKLESLIDPGSTASISVEAEWLEFADLLPITPKSGVKGSRTGIVSHSLRRTFQIALPPALPPPSVYFDLVRPLQGVVASVVHNFTDTKHRHVKYSLVLTSLAPRQFDVAQHHGFSASDLQQRVEIRDYHIKSSAAPSAPTLNLLLPAFTFDEETFSNPQGAHGITRIRSMVIQVPFQRDWMSSGEGEEFALMLVGAAARKQPFDAVYPDYRGVASFWGADPTRQSGGALSRLPRYLSPEHVTGSSKTVSLSISIGSGSSVQSVPVDVLLFPRQLNANGDQWLVNIGIQNPSTVSRPHVRLAFARYQEQSLPGLELSPVILADYIQLLDSRVATVSWRADGSGALSVSIVGPGFVGSDRSVTPYSYAQVQEFSGLGEDGTEIWANLGNRVLMDVTFMDGQRVCHCPLPRPKKHWSRRHRVLLIELDTYYTGTFDANSNPVQTSIPIYFDLIEFEAQN